MKRALPSDGAHLNGGYGGRWRHPQALVEVIAVFRV
jgi:hypothetical protein